MSADYSIPASKRLLVAFCYTVAVTIGGIALFDCFFRTNDDFAMMCRSAGIVYSAQPSPLLVFVSAFVGKAIVLLYQINREMPWYTLVQLALLVAAHSVILASLKGSRKSLILPYVIYAFAFILPSVTRPQFTVTSIFLAVGALALIISPGKFTIPRGLCCAVLLILSGLFRELCGFLGGAMGIASVVLIMATGGVSRESLSKILVVIGSVIIFQQAWHFERNRYSEHFNEYQSLSEPNHWVLKFVNYRTVNWGAPTQEDLDDAGVSVFDVGLFTRWAFYRTDVDPEALDRAEARFPRLRPGERFSEALDEGRRRALELFSVKEGATFVGPVVFLFFLLGARRMMPVGVAGMIVSVFLLIAMAQFMAPKLAGTPWRFQFPVVCQVALVIVLLSQRRECRLLFERWLLRWVAFGFMICFVGYGLFLRKEEALTGMDFYAFLLLSGVVLANASVFFRFPGKDPIAPGVKYGLSALCGLVACLWIVKFTVDAQKDTEMRQSFAEQARSALQYYEGKREIRWVGWPLVGLHRLQAFDSPAAIQGPFREVISMSWLSFTPDYLRILKKHGAKDVVELLKRDDTVLWCSDADASFLGAQLTANFGEPVELVRHSEVEIVESKPWVLKIKPQ